MGNMKAVLETKTGTMTPNNIIAELDQYHGTTKWYTHRNPRTGKVCGYYTDGVKRMAEICNAQWLIDAIFSHQYKPTKDCPFQVWILEKMLDNEARKYAYLLSGEDGNGKTLQRQVIPYSDFPLKKIKLFMLSDLVPIGDIRVETKILVLPGER
jgi:hypothetical protein